MQKRKRLSHWTSCITTRGYLNTGLPQATSGATTHLSRGAIRPNLGFKPAPTWHLTAVSSTPTIREGQCLRARFRVWWPSRRQPSTSWIKRTSIRTTIKLYQAEVVLMELTTCNKIGWKIRIQAIQVYGKKTNSTCNKIWIQWYILTSRQRMVQAVACSKIKPTQMGLIAFTWVKANLTITIKV